MTDPTDSLWRRKVAALLNAAVADLSPDDYALRQAYCHEHGEHGVRAHPEGAVVTFMWGGLPLLVVERALFDDDADLADARAERIGTDVPDHVPAEWSDTLGGNQ